MSRFFKSAAFPILIVVVLAFFAQKLISPGTQEQPPSYGDFIAQLQAGQIKTVDLKTKDNTLTVKLRSGQEYETGYPPEAADRLDTPPAGGQADARRSRTTTSRAARATAGCRCSPTSCPS